MRLKLVILASLLAAIVSSGAAIGIILGVSDSLRPVTAPSLLVLASFLLPAALILLASIFVYRHTARRRKLQAFLTALISLVLTLSIFMIATVVTSRLKPKPPQPMPQPQIS